jgi:hypothetical protein
MGQLKNVVICGAVGGLLTWLFGLWLGHSSHVHTYVDPVLSSALGAGAAAVFVFLIANTDREDRPRLLTLGLLAGFFWEPVWEGGRALIDRQIESNQVAEAKRATERAAELAAAISTANEQERSGLLDELNEQIELAASATEGIDSVTARSSITGPVNRLLVNLSELEPEGDLRQNALRLAAQVTPRDELMTLQTMAQYSDPRVDFLMASVDPGMLATSLTEAGFASGTYPIHRTKLSESDLPADEEIVTLQIGGSSDVTPAANEEEKYFWLPIEERRLYVVEMQAEDGDLVGEIYDRASLTRIASDDDSGGNRNPEIRTMLAAGNYLIRVTEYGGGELPPFTISARIAQATDN